MRIEDVYLDPVGRSRWTLTSQYLVNVYLGAPGWGGAAPTPAPSPPSATERDAESGDGTSPAGRG